MKKIILGIILGIILIVSITAMAAGTYKFLTLLSAQSAATSFTSSPFATLQFTQIGIQLSSTDSNEWDNVYLQSSNDNATWDNIQFWVLSGVSSTTINISSPGYRYLRLSSSFIKGSGTVTATVNAKGSIP